MPLISAESDTAGIWIHNPPDEMIVAGVCKALETGFSDGRVFDKNDVQCDTLLPFMCRKRKSITGRTFFLFQYAICVLKELF